MGENSTKSGAGIGDKGGSRAGAASQLLPVLLTLLQAHRRAFGQERSYRRAVGLVFGEVFALGRHTVTQGLLALGLGQSDWSAWYRLFSCERFDEEELGQCLLQETLEHVAAQEPYVIGIDSTQIRRSSQKMPGTTWLRAASTAIFQRGLQRAQRFEQGAWLPPLAQGYTRAIPLRFLPAFPAKAVPSCATAMKEWAAGLQFVCWVRQTLNQAGRLAQPVLVLADGAYDTVDFWCGLPAHTVAIVRTARNRHLRLLPPPYCGRGRRRKYGDVAPAPAAWLQQRKGWQKTTVAVRGRHIQMRYRVLGPYLREGAPDIPLWLIVVGGATWRAGKRTPRRAERQPAFYLVATGRANLAPGNLAGKVSAQLLSPPSPATLPMPAPQLLAWVWQRWELEVAHREMKSSFGIGDKQCWNKRSAVVAVQWSVWVYAVLLLAGYRTWGWFDAPPVPSRWWSGAARWSFNTLWRTYRIELWRLADFHPVWSSSGDDWPKMDDWLIALPNAVTALVKA